MSESYTKSAYTRATSIRARTWAVTVAIVSCLLLYLAVSLVKKQFDVLEFILMVFVQVVIHFAYFPDGEIFGQKDKTFLSNKATYNHRADLVNSSRAMGRLHEYCKHEFEVRKKDYVANMCGKAGITTEDLELFKDKTKKEILSLNTWENGGRFITLAKYQRKIIVDILFKELPIEENKASTIMSALETNNDRAIRDDSIHYKTVAHVKKIGLSFCLGGLFALIGYTLRDGFGWEQVASIAMYITTMLSTAVLSFTSGETCTKVHKNNFYLKLSNFLVGFFEWADIKEQGETPKNE